MGDRVLYIGTNDDVVEVTEGSNGIQCRSLDPGVGGTEMDGVRAILVDAADPAQLYVGTNTEGVLRSDDGGSTWRPVNEGITYKNIWALAQHPATGDLYAGTEPASVFRSRDAGETWEDLPNLRGLRETREWWFPLPPHVAHIRSITLRADAPDDIFCAVEDGWLVRSRDGGASWKQVGGEGAKAGEVGRQGVHCDAHTITFLPDDPNLVYAATGDYGFRSTDGGETFVAARDGLERGYMAGVVAHPDRPRTLLTVVGNPPGAWFHTRLGAQTAVFRSQDAGLTWRRVGQGFPDEERWGTWAVSADPQQPDTAYVGLFDGRIWATDDFGDTFREVGQIDGAVLTMVCARRG